MGQPIHHGKQPPTWARALVQWDTWIERAHRGHQALREALLCQFLTQEAQEQLTANAYARNQARYSQGGSLFAHGLFHWEQAALERLALPPHARILLGGAGGGRELAALINLGYRVTAFEPVPALCANAQRLAGPNAQVRCGGYADLLAAIQGTGPLARLQGPFDAVIFGWASLSHLTDGHMQCRILKAVRTIAPEASILLSFFAADPLPSSQRRLRSALARLSRRTPVPHNLRHFPHCGFVLGFDGPQLQTLAKETGYRVIYQEAAPAPHALFEPASDLAYAALGSPHISRDTSNQPPGPQSQECRD